MLEKMLNVFVECHSAFLCYPLVSGHEGVFFVSKGGKNRL